MKEEENTIITPSSRTTQTYLVFNHLRFLYKHIRYSGDLLHAKLRCIRSNSTKK